MRTPVTELTNEELMEQAIKEMPEITNVTLMEMFNRFRYYLERAEIDEYDTADTTYRR